MTKIRILLSILMLLTMAFMCLPANATPLVAGGTVVPSAFTGSPGTLLATNTATFVSTLGVSDFSGTVTESVYLDSITGNTMDFVYQFTNNAGSAKPIEQMSDSSYDAFLTDVSQSVTAFGAFTGGGTLAATADRSASGGNIAWDGTWGGSGSSVASAILMIKTNANSFMPGTVSFINSGTVTLTGFFAPSEVPEPTFYGLLGAGLIGLIWVSRKQKVSQPTN
jgi:PEP-CTERM motif